MTQTILLVEDDEAIAEMIQDALQRHGFRSVRARDAAQGEVLIRSEHPVLVLLDWMLPGISGVEFARKLRRDDETRSIPIIMLTARSEEPDRIKGFDAGIDDYVVKPFSIRELVARIKAVLRRSQAEREEDPIEVDGLCLDPLSHRVTANGATIKIGPTEFRMLYLFMTHQDRVFTRNQMLDRVWGDNVYIEERTVDVHVRRLRKALENAGFDRFVQTVHGTGYRFSRDD